MNVHRLTELQESLGYTFQNVGLLDAAITHSSYANENKKNRKNSNERLEFLGDAVLGMTVSMLIYDYEKILTEGKMTKIRAELVCERSLAALAGKFGLGSHIKLGRGEERGGGRERASILADAVEAIIAAMYLDGGFEAVKGFITAHLITTPDWASQKNTDYKTSLQEIVQLKQEQVLSYHIVDESGPDHAKFFEVEVKLNDVTIGQGSGKSKKEAEQLAAKVALDNRKWLKGKR